MKRFLIIGFTGCVFALAPTMSASAMQQHPIRWAAPMGQSFRSKAVTGMGMGGTIMAVAATTTVGTVAITMVGGTIIIIGGDV